MPPPAPISVILCGIAGYGAVYLDTLSQEGAAHGVRLVAAVDPLVSENSPAATRLQQLGVSLHSTLADALARHPARLVVLATPIHRHAPDTLTALEHGSDVLCEKPIAGNLADAQRMLEASRRHAQFVAIGFQWSFTRVIRDLKARILAGAWGAPRQFRTKVYWPRPGDYYRRNSWAGVCSTPDGSSVNDSPLNNAAAHFLHNMLFLLGPSPSASAEPIAVDAECWRAHPIENFDTAAVRVRTAGNVEVLFYTTHATSCPSGPDIVLEFERGTIRYPGPHRQFIATDPTGRIQPLGDPDSEPLLSKLWQCADAARNGHAPSLDISGAMAHTQVVEAVQRNSAGIHTIAPRFINTHPLPDGDTQIEVTGLAETFDFAFTQGCLPRELPAPMANAAWLRD